MEEESGFQSCGTGVFRIIFTFEGAAITRAEALEQQLKWNIKGGGFDEKSIHQVMELLLPFSSQNTSCAFKFEDHKRTHCSQCSIQV